MSYKKILIAVDESKTSCLALYETIPLAKNLNAKLCILSIAPSNPTRGYISKGEALTKYQNSIKLRHEKLLEDMRQMAIEEGITPEIILVDLSVTLNNVPENIIQVVKKWGADLLVVGTHCRKGTRRLLLGSTAEETLRKSPVPILLIPSNEAD